MMVMVTPGSTPPDVSVTVPAIVACCANADTAARIRAAGVKITRFKPAFMTPPVEVPGARNAPNRPNNTAHQPRARVASRAERRWLTAAEYARGSLEPAGRCCQAAPDRVSKPDRPIISPRIQLLKGRLGRFPGRATLHE